MDLALILTLLTAVTGLVVAVEKFVLSKKRAGAPESSGRSLDTIVEYSRSFFPVLLFVLIIRSFVFEPFRIPSGSMMPTLLEGDFIFVNKFAYGLRLPVINSKIVEVGEPRRGDVIVFKLPSEPSINYIKRVVGLPGDVVNYDQGSKQLTINGEKVPMELFGPFQGDPGLELAREKLGGAEHELLLTRGRLSLGGTYRVPENHYFVMGDNRDNSRDSRFQGVEFIPEERLVGKAVRIWMNWRGPSEGGPRWSRIGMSID